MENGFSLISSICKLLSHTWKRKFNKQTLKKMCVHVQKSEREREREQEKSRMIIIARCDLWLGCLHKDQFFDQYYDSSTHIVGTNMLSRHQMTWTMPFLCKKNDTLSQHNEREKKLGGSYWVHVDTVAMFDLFHYSVLVFIFFLCVSLSLFRVRCTDF